MSRLLPSHSNAMRLKPQRTQSGFVIESTSEPAVDSSSAAGAPYVRMESLTLPKYEPLYVLSYGVPGTPASEGHWCVVLADDMQSASGTRTFSLHGLCRETRPVIRHGRSNSTSEATSRKRRRVTFQDDPVQPTGLEKQRRRTDPETSAERPSILIRRGASSSMFIPVISGQIPNEVRQVALRSTALPIEYFLKNSNCLADCLQEGSASLKSENVYRLEEGDQKVLGIVEIAQLPLNFIDVEKKRLILNRIQLEVSHGNLGGKDLDDARREYVVRVVNGLTGAWKIGCKDLPIGVKATVQTVARLFGSQSSSL